MRRYMVGILDELQATRTQVAVIQEWLDAQPKKEREEWLEAFARADLYPTSAILALIEKKGGVGISENGLMRYRRRMENYVSGR